jgi:hypothetical protein
MSGNEQSDLRVDAISAKRHLAPSDQQDEDQRGSSARTDSGIADQLHDRVIDHLFGSRLTLASIVSLGKIDTKIAERLQDVMDDLEIAVRDIRRTDLALLARHCDQRPNPPHHLTIVKPPSDRVQQPRTVRGDGHRYLCSFEDGQVFAYTTHAGHDFLRVADHSTWAHESDGLLLSARSGTPLARRMGNVFHAITSNMPLYYERTD